MALVATELSSICGVLEPLQTADSVEGQTQELRTVLSGNAQLPAVLIGHSWGAWLAFMVAARYPEIARKLILVSSGPFEDKYVPLIAETRLARLNPAQREELENAQSKLDDPQSPARDSALARIGELMSFADAYDPLPDKGDSLDVDARIFNKVWTQAAALRKSGKLIAMAESIRCPVVAIHGDCDPHPADGVRIPLSRYISDFRFVLLERCGHQPWMERQARDRFFDILKREIV
jgi:pimeloyl-ACP methyl ester carboxylesterase